MQGIRFGNLEYPTKQNSTYSCFITMPNEGMSKPMPKDTLTLSQASEPTPPKKKSHKVLWGALATAIAAIAIKLIFFRKKPKFELGESSELFDKSNKILKETWKDEPEKTLKRKVFQDYTTEVAEALQHSDELGLLNGGRESLQALKYVLGGEKIGINEQLGKIPDVITLEGELPKVIRTSVAEIARIFKTHYTFIDATKDPTAALKKLEDTIRMSTQRFKKDKSRTFIHMEGIENLSKIDEDTKLRVENFFQNCAEDTGIISFMKKDEVKHCNLQDPPLIELCFGYE